MASAAGSQAPSNDYTHVRAGSTTVRQHCVQHCQPLVALLVALCVCRARGLLLYYHFVALLNNSGCSFHSASVFFPFSIDATTLYYFLSTSSVRVTRLLQPTYRDLSPVVLTTASAIRASLIRCHGDSHEYRPIHSLLAFRLQINCGSKRVFESHSYVWSNNQ